MYINWVEIQGKYRKAYNKFIYYLLDNKLSALLENNSLKLNKEKICYCDIERFFDEQGIIINICYLEELKKGSSFSWHLFFEKNEVGNRKDLFEWSDNFNEFLTRNEAKEQAVYKAFEILEGKLCMK